ncbi:MAG TPA: Zn-ribbon domain-containing OB-fold protein [Candidatus Acidoferrales bacterium]|nr:Zn-ribbon domain-containing OB-fold protein [Candidatus Acidoferrales bacterium]
MFAIEKPLPRPNEDSAPYWEAAQRGELRMQRCTGCSHVRFPPSLLCPRCLSPQHEWAKLSGRGTVYSWIVVHQSQHPAFNADVPYNVTIVELAEGPRLHTHIVECANDQIRIGMPVEVVFERINDEVTLPKFKPIRSQK